VKEAERIISEQVKAVTFLEESYDLGSSISAKDEREPSSKETSLWQKLIDKKLEIDKTDARKYLVSYKLRKAIGTANLIPGVAHYQIKEGKDVFDEKSFKEANPILHDQYYTIISERVTGTFSLRKKKSLAKHGVELYNVKKELEKKSLRADKIEIGVESTRNEIIEGYHEKYIDLQKKSYSQQWEYDQLEAQLKCYVGLNAGLTGLCGWNRSSKENRRFDKNRFQEERPGLYDKFSKYKGASYSFMINSWRPYSKSETIGKKIIVPTRIIENIKSRISKI